MARAADPQRRETILRAATEVFIEQGYSDTRLIDIAKRAGVVVSTLYLYFNSKEEMVRAIAQEIQRQLVEQLRPVLENLKGKEDIVQFVEIISTFAGENQDQLRVLHLDTGLNSVRWRIDRRLNDNTASRPKKGLHMVNNLIIEDIIYPYKPTFVLDMLFGFGRWMMENYTLLEPEEQPPFKTFCVQWLCNALLRQ